MTEAASICIHATTISFEATAVIIRGGSGAGKSDLALQLLETGGNGLTGRMLLATLVADDQTLLRLEGDRVLASAPEAIRGLLEVRGQGLVQVQTVQDISVVLIVDLLPQSEIERMPEQFHSEATLLGKIIPRIAIDPATASAATRLRLAWAKLASCDKSP